MSTEEQLQHGLAAWLETQCLSPNHMLHGQHGMYTVICGVFYCLTCETARFIPWLSLLFKYSCMGSSHATYWHCSGWGAKPDPFEFYYGMLMQRPSLVPRLSSSLFYTVTIMPFLMYVTKIACSLQYRQSYLLQRLHHRNPQLYELDPD